MQLHAFIEGSVQGVGFRFSTQQLASDLGLTGWVKNLDDGQVEVLAEGDKTILDSFLTWLQKGPEGAYVSHVQFEFTNKPLKFHYFSIE